MMKKYSQFLVFTISIFLFSCGKDKSSFDRKDASQENSNYIVNSNDILKMANFFSEKNRWILVDVDFLRAEDDPNLEIGENEIDGLLVFDYFNFENDEILKTGYFNFKITAPNRYELIQEFGNSCTGVNCSKCKLENPWMRNSYCDCKKIGHPEGVASYCNHSTASITYLTALTESEEEINKLILDNPESLIQEVKELLQK